MNENQKRTASTLADPPGRVWDASTGELISGPPPPDSDERSRQELTWLRDLDRRARKRGVEVLIGSETVNADGSVTRTERGCSKAQLRAEYREHRTLRSDPSPRRRYQRYLELQRRARAETVTTTLPPTHLRRPPRSGKHRRAPEKRPVRRHGSRRAGGARSGQDPGDEGSDESDQRPCPEGCGGTIRKKPGAGRWPARCADCKRARERERGKRRRAKTSSKLSRDCAARACTEEVHGRNRYCSDACKAHEARCRERERADHERARIGGYLEFAKPGELHAQTFRYTAGAHARIRRDERVEYLLACGDPGEREALLERAGHAPLLTSENGAAPRRRTRPLSVTPERYAGLLERFGSLDRVETALRELPRAARRQQRERLRALVAEAIETAPAWGFAVSTNGHHAEAVVA